MELLGACSQPRIHTYMEMMLESQADIKKKQTHPHMHTCTCTRTERTRTRTHTYIHTHLRTYIHTHLRNDREMALVDGGEQADAGEANMKKSLFSTAFHSALNEHVLEEEQKKITTYEGMYACM